MKPSLSQLIQRLEYIIQQLKSLEAIFAGSGNQNPDSISKTDVTLDSPNSIDLSLHRDRLKN